MPHFGAASCKPTVSRPPSGRAVVTTDEPELLGQRFVVDPGCSFCELVCRCGFGRLVPRFRRERSVNDDGHNDKDGQDGEYGRDGAVEDALLVLNLRSGRRSIGHER